MIENKKDYYKAVTKSFNKHRDSGLSITQATKRVMEEFGILTPTTVFNIRRRARELEAENGGQSK